MISEEELLKAIDVARKHGAVTLVSNDPHKDRQKVYRTLEKMKENDLPLFPNEDKFEVGVSGNTLIIKRKQIDHAFIVPTALDKPKRRKKSIFVEKQEKDLEGYEAQIEREAYKLPPDVMQYHKEKIMIRRIAIEYYLDTDLEIYMPVARGDSIDWDKKVMKAFDPDYKEEADLPTLSRRELVAQRMGEIRNSSDPAEQREFQHLLELHERLVLEEDKKWTNADGLLG